jgi:uncharacterized protein (DUF2237 family)
VTQRRDAADGLCTHLPFDVMKRTLCACMSLQMLAGTRAGGSCIWFGWLAEPVQHIRIPDFINKT